MLKARTHIKEAILREIPYHPDDIVNKIHKRFDLSKKTIRRYLKEMMVDKKIYRSSLGRYPGYQIISKGEEKTFLLKYCDKDFSQIIESIGPLMADIKVNVKELIKFGIQEILQFEKEFGHATVIELSVTKDQESIEFRIKDNGAGFFNSLKNYSAVSENLLMPINCSEAEMKSFSFPCSPLFDFLSIISDNICCIRENNHIWVMEDSCDLTQGTIFQFRFSLHSQKDLFRLTSEMNHEELVTHLTLNPNHFGPCEKREHALNLMNLFNLYSELIFDLSDADYSNEFLITIKEQSEVDDYPRTRVLNTRENLLW